MVYAYLLAWLDLQCRQLRLMSSSHRRLLHLPNPQFDLLGSVYMQYQLFEERLYIDLFTVRTCTDMYIRYTTTKPTPKPLLRLCDSPFLTVIWGFYNYILIKRSERGLKQRLIKPITCAKGWITLFIIFSRSFGPNGPTLPSLSITFVHFFNIISEAPFV